MNKQINKRIIIVCFALANLTACFNNNQNYADAYRNISHLILTKHVRCRMDCRHISEEEIKEIIQNGSINNDKSRVGSKGDQTYAMEGYDNEHQHLRVVVAPENDGLVVITCIDLGHDWPCNCN